MGCLATKCRLKSGVNRISPEYQIKIESQYAAVSSNWSKIAGF